jgi:WD40 repeat protein
VEAMALSADGKTLAVGNGINVQLWDLTKPASPLKAALLSDSTGALDELALSADGRTLATAGSYGVVLLWDTTDRRRPRQLAQVVGDSGSTSAVTLSPDGRTLVNSGPDGAILLWDLTDRSNPRRLARLDGDVSSMSTMAFGADGNSLAAGSRRSAGVWDLAHLNDLRQHVIERACAVTGGLTRDQWVRYVPDVPYEKTCQRREDQRAGSALTR